VLFWQCRGKQYYAGHVGTQSRHPGTVTARRALPDANAM